MENRDTNIQKLHARVSGLVQGVGFRYFVLQNARLLNLTGWVRNLYTGEVEVQAEGDTESLNQLLEALQEGPPGSRVREVRHQWLPADGQETSFSVRV